LLVKRASHRKVLVKKVRGKQTVLVKTVLVLVKNCTPDQHTQTHANTYAFMRGRTMLDPVPHSTSRTVDQTLPNEREGGGAFTVWSDPRGWLSKLITY
jgi:hypothetical protein